MYKKQTQLWKQMLSIMLAIALLVTSVEISALAAPVGETTESEIVLEDATESTEEDIEEDSEEIVVSDGTEEGVEAEGLAEEVSPQQEARILSEVEEEREETSKTFQLSDGTFMVAQYDMPVHYEDSEGKWKDIDHSLVVDGMGTDDEGYQTTEKTGENERIKFSKKLKEGKTVSIKNTEYPISWGIAGAAMQTVEVTSAEGEEPKNWNDKFLLQDLNTQILTYPDIFEGVDVEYLVQSGGIKENIILKEPGLISTFEIVYDIGKLTAEQKDEQTILLKNGDEVIYQIYAPYMTDADGAISDSLALTMEQTNKKEIKVTISTDSDWLQEEERSYPVIIDPWVITETTRDAIDSTFVTSGDPNEKYHDKLELLVGKESSGYKKCRTLFKIDIPELNAGDMIVDAQLHLMMYQYQFYADSVPDVQINAHQIVENWAYDDVTWNTQPNIENKVLDYNYIRQDDNETGKWQKTFNITEAVKSWYEGTANHGIMIKVDNEDGDYTDVGVKAYFAPERYNSNSSSYPVIQITYRNNKGLEDYWTYTTLSAGTAGTAYINDYTGNLVFVHDDISTTGELMPVTIQHVYNGYQMNQKYTRSYPSAGRGWKLSIQQTLLSSEVYGLTGKSLELYPYAYEDGDGTVHYFYKKEEDGKTKYLDEDGLGLELTISGNIKTIKDKDDNTMTFGVKGNLTSIADAYGNKITLSYITAEDGITNMIHEVTDGAGHSLVMEEHNTSTYNLKYVSAVSNKDILYSYDVYNTTSGNKSVSKIHYPDGTSSSYTYDSEGSLLTAVSSDGSGLKFTYTTKKKGKRVSQVEEFGTNGTTGQTISFDRSKYNTTVVRSSGEDDIFGNSDDLMTTYKFDNFGRTIATNTKTESGIHYGGDVYSYTAGEVNTTGTNIRKLNRVSEEAFSSKCVYNLLENHSGESSSGWKYSYWLSSESEYEVEYTTAQSLYGNQSLAIHGNQDSTNGGGAFYQVFSTDELEPGKDYTFSGYIKTVDVTKSNTVDAAYGGCLAVRFTSSSGSFTRLYSDYVTGTSPTGYNDGWRRVKLSFTVPTDATEVRVFTVLRNSKGTAYFDGLQLETGTSANTYNLLSNSSFEKVSSNKPSGWTLINNNSSDGNSSTHYFSGTTALKFEGEASVNKYAYQNVFVSGSESDIYIASGWAWAEALPDAEDITRSFDIFARVYYSDNTSVLKSKKAEFNRDVTGWQRASMAFDLDDGDDKNKRTPTEIRVGVRYYKQENAAYFDSLQLLKDTSNSYTYDEDGNLITAKENGDQSSALSYDDNSNLTSLTDAENNLYKYEYNTKHQVTEATAPLGQKISYTYKSKGPLSSTVISSPGGDLKLKTEILCNNSSGDISAQAYVTQEIDQNGYATKYNVDLVSGRTNSVTTPDGTVTSYSYNTDNDLLTKVSSGGKSVTYGYDSSQSKLLSIGHNGFSYNFAYDVFGNVLSTSVGNQALSTNTYAANNGKLTTTAYGNGDTKSYTYTKAGNLSKIEENGTKTDSWTYNYSQQPMTYTDHETEQKHTYDYDITGRLLETKVLDTTVTNTAKDAQLFQVLYGYDELNRLERSRVYAGERSPYAIYSYNKNSQSSKVDFSNGRSLSYTYDNLGRLTGKDYSTTTALEYDYLYHTSARAETEGTAYKTTQVKNELMGNMGYRYTYDKMGNITLIEEGTRKAGTVNTLENLSDKISYVYDDQSQLIRENNLYLNKTIVYTYDNGGNIVSKAEYDYTTDEDLSGKTIKSTINYTYDSTWKDLLKSYDGSNITYDEIGNPEKYLGKTMVWNGRTLESLTESGTTSSYDYNSDGLRTRKTVGNKVHEYYYSNGQLAYEKRSDGKELFFTYDADGLLILIQYVQNGSHVYYYPMLNSRGDVEALYTYQGELVARYYYDTWGNVIGIKDASGNDITATDHIANVNPIRYRGYYYDVETGFYYVSSRYYDPEVGRFISADEAIAGVGGNVLGYNMFAYCFNNPVNMSDPDGNWPKWVNKVVNTVKKVVNTVTKWVNKAKKKIEKVCGFTTQVDKEKATSSKYRGVYSQESGTGYNKSFNTGKSVNVYNTIPNISEDIFDAGIGIDFNINGYGATMQTGVENSFSVNLPNQSFEWGGKPFGRNYFKHSYIDDSGIYVYNKLTINTPEIGAGILLFYYQPYLIPIGAAGMARGAYAH